MRIRGKSVLRGTVLPGLIGALLVISVVPIIDLGARDRASIAAVVAATVADLANDARVAAGREPLTISPALTAIAARKADDMARAGYFAHVSPTGATPWQWFAEEGYVFRYAGENLAIDFDTSSEVVRAWMLSPQHRANIVGTQFTEMGVAVSQGMYEGRPATFVVQMFGTPGRESRAPVQEVSRSESANTRTTVAAQGSETAPEILGTSAGAYLAAPAVPWWYRVLAYFSL
ncbi:hypothetical protein KGO06_01020 [Patescibacteria group bacterium]|nr:hypothetical protein [Patescibacteria group bacterium]